MNDPQPSLLPATPVPAPADLADRLSSRACEQCGKAFTPRLRSGGKRQRFCSSTCRADFHAQRGQRSPTCINESRGPVPDSGAPEGASALTPAPLDWFDPPDADEDWRSDECRVINDQPETFVYLNSWDQIIVRQVAEVFDENPFIRLDPANAVKLAKHLLALVEELRAESSG